MTNIFSKFNNNKDNIFGYSSFLGFITTFFYTWYSIYKSNWSIDFQLAIVMVSLVNLFLAVFGFYMIRKFNEVSSLYSDYLVNKKQMTLKIKELKSQVNNERKLQYEIATITHNIQHKTRDVSNKFFQDIVSGDFSHFHERQKSFEKFMFYFVGNIKQLFDIITGDKCSVSIKLIVPSSVQDKGNAHIETYIRDNISYRERGAIDRKLSKYPYFENTAFKLILSESEDANYFLSNNLSNEQGYNNKHDGWESYYNACIVVPIRLILSEGTYLVIGFICVDNINGNFEEKIGLNILASYADSCFQLFSSYNELSEAAKENQLPADNL